MAHVLFAVANATGAPASLTSTENPGDNCPIPVGITHTGGNDGDWIYLPDCSDSTYWAAHHITVAATNGAWAVSFWANDDQNNRFYWSNSNSYSEANPVPTSDNIDNSAVMITIQNGLPVVTWTVWS
jgi:hypothetical protein